MSSPESWVHASSWQEEEGSANKEEGQEVCRKIAEIDALWRISCHSINAADDVLSSANMRYPDPAIRRSKRLPGIPHSPRTASL